VVLQTLEVAGEKVSLFGKGYKGRISGVSSIEK